MKRQHWQTTLALAAVLAAPLAAQAWEPTKTVEFIVPAGTGGGADQMARAIQGIIAKHGLMKQSMVVVNKSGGAGAEGFLDVKNAKGDPHKIIITLSNLFTTPLAQGTPFSWKDLTPVKMMALDEFVLWVNAETPYKSAKDYIDAAKQAGARKVKTGRPPVQEGGHRLAPGEQDHRRVNRAEARQQVHFHPVKGGGDVAVQLVGK